MVDQLDCDVQITQVGLSVYPNNGEVSPAGTLNVGVYEAIFSFQYKHGKEIWKRIDMRYML